jgi:AraC-like DNA-binding protein
MAFNLRIWSLGFTAIAIGALITLALSLSLARRSGQLRVALVLTCLSAVCASATHGPFVLLVLREAAGLHWAPELRWPLVAAGEALVGVLWLSVMVLFEDARITPLRIAPAALLASISFVNLLSGRHGVLMWLPIPINLALAAHVLVCLARGWRGDLVERRRRLRRPLLGVFALVLGLVLTTQIAVAAGGAGIAATADWNLINAVLDVVIAAAAVAVAALLLEPSGALLAEPPPRPSTRSDDEADDAALARLQSLIEGEVWRREGLTVGALATEVGLPEHRLRVLINGRLGHRNFAAFINARRIEAARRQLADPAFADTPISKIAYDLGFASLGPFNRAFKDATGATPTEWRRAEAGISRSF